MVNKKRTGAALLAVFLLVGCASPSVETEQNLTATHTQEELHQDDGRHVTANFSLEDDLAFNIDADVSISNQPLEQGKLQNAEWDISSLAAILCPDIELHLEEEQEGYISYVGGEPYSDLDYNTSISIDADSNDLLYSNYQLDEYFLADSYEVKKEEDWTEADQTFVLSMEDRVSALYSQLNMEAQVDKVELYTPDGKSNCSITMSRMLGGYLLLDSLGSDVNDFIHIADCGINGIQFASRYEAVDASETPVLSVDEILSIVEKGVENKNINAYSSEFYDYTIKQIMLAYMIQDRNGEQTFLPVWVLRDGNHITILALDARDGSVVYMQ